VLKIPDYMPATNPWGFLEDGVRKDHAEPEDLTAGN